MSNIFTSCTIGKVIKGLNQVGKSEPVHKEYFSEIPFNFVRHQIVIKSQLAENTDQGSYIFDTGACTVIKLEDFKRNNFPTIYIMPDLASTLRIDSVHKNDIKTLYPLISEVKLNDLEFKNVGALVTDGLEQFSCLAPDGIIGANIVNDGVVQIDYSKQILVIADDIERLNNIEGVAKVKFKTYGPQKTPLVPFILNGKKYWFTFDTGSGNGVVLSPELLTYFSDSEKAKATNFKTKGLGTAYSEHENKPLDGKILRLQEFKIGSLSVPFQEVNVMNLPFFEKHPLRKQTHGNLGNKFLKDYIITINWKNNTIYFAPQPNKVKKANDAHFGFVGRFNTDKKYIVQNLFEGSEAEKAGIKLNDEIIAVNGNSTENLTQERYCELSSYPEILIPDILETATFKIKHKNGEIKEFTFNRQPLLPEAANATSKK